MFDLTLTRSTTVGILMAFPHDDRAPFFAHFSDLQFSRTSVSY